MGFWIYAELSTGVICGCLPISPKFFQAVKLKLSTSTTFAPIRTFFETFKLSSFSAKGRDKFYAAEKSRNPYNPHRKLTPESLSLEMDGMRDQKLIGFNVLEEAWQSDLSKLSGDEGFRARSAMIWSFLFVWFFFSFLRAEIQIRHQIHCHYLGENCCCHLIVNTVLTRWSHWTVWTWCWHGLIIILAKVADPIIEPCEHGADTVKSLWPD